MKSKFFNHQRQRSTIAKQNLFFHNSNMDQQASASPLPKQQEFFPVLNLKKINPIKMRQIYLIKQKQRRQGLGLLKKLAYKQIIQSQRNQQKSLQKYQQVRKQRYGKLSNISFIKVNQRIRHQNRFSTINISKQQPNDRKHKHKNYKSIHSDRNGFQQYQKSRLRYLMKQANDQQGKTSHNPQQLKQSLRNHAKYDEVYNNRNSGILSLDEQKNRQVDYKLREKERINNMILQYRQYEQQQFAKLRHTKKNMEKFFPQSQS